ncbi:MAG TPA: farnesyl diphosphate synthase [Fimbriimonadaceae bacterium]|nr:farnesyl diphosphate synthase [Fimbriimonadaceae bacterium]
MPLDIQLKAYADAVNGRLDRLLPPAAATPVELHEAMRYSCLAPGKRLRPALCMACAEAVGAEPESVIDAACSLEMVHCFSLIHDDLPAIDDDALRRGIPTCHKRFGEAIAILAGDALFSLAFETLSHCDFEPRPVLGAVQVLTRAAGSDGLVGGEVVDVLSEGVPVEAERLRYIHSRKTGALMSASCEIGAILGGGGEAQIEALRGFGEKVGLAFQIADDILNETADAATLGKAVGSDRQRKKATYTALYGLAEARRMAEETAAQAKAALSGVRRQEFLEELADFTVRRLH